MRSRLRTQAHVIRLTYSHSLASIDFRRRNSGANFSFPALRHACNLAEELVSSFTTAIVRV